MLLAAGATPNVENSQGRDASDIAPKAFRREIVKILLAAKADPKWSKLGRAIACRHPQTGCRVGQTAAWKTARNPNAKGEMIGSFRFWGLTGRPVGRGSETHWSRRFQRNSFRW